MRAAKDACREQWRTRRLSSSGILVLAEAGMGVLWDDVAGYVTLQLVGRGLRPGEIDQALKKLVGKDWNAVRVSEWKKRLREQDFEVPEDAEKFLDGLEVLIRGKIKLDELQK